jgi:hypothetical protein
MFRVLDADTFFCANFEETLATARAVDASGYEYQGITQASSPALVDGPYSGKRARRLTVAGAYFSQLAVGPDVRPFFRGNCTVQIVFKSRSHTTYAANARGLLQVALHNDWYFFAHYQVSNPGNGVRLYYNNGTNTGPNTGGLTYEVVNTGLPPPEDTWVMLTVRKTVTSGTTDANKLNAIDVWLTPLSTTIDANAPDFSRANVINPNALNWAPYYGIGYWNGAGGYTNDADIAGIRCVKRALTAAEISESFSWWNPTPSSSAAVSSVAVTPTVDFSAPGDFGSDFSTFPDLAAGMSLITGRRVLGEAILRRFVTQRGSLRFHPEYGFDLRELLCAGMTDRQLHYLKAGIEQEAEKDERVERASAVLTYDGGTSALSVQLELETTEGPYSLTLLVTQLDIALLEAA